MVWALVPVSGAPTRIRPNQLLNPHILTGMTVKKIIMKAPPPHVI